MTSAGILAGPQIDFDNLYPITTNDIGSFLEMQIPIMGMLSLIFMVFFIGSKFNDTGELKKYGIRSAIFVAILGFLSVFLTVGIFGPVVTKNLSLPFSMAMKEINILDKIYGLESIIVSMWLISDIAICVASIYVINNLFSVISKTGTNREYVTPIIFLAYIISLWIVKNRYEYEFLVRKIGVYVNIFLGFTLPLIILIIGKIRKRV